jgi:hypothetical protein
LDVKWLQRTEKDEFLPEARPALCKAQSHLLAVPGYEQPELIVGPEKETTVAIKSMIVFEFDPQTGAFRGLLYGESAKFFVINENSANYL